MSQTSGSGGSGNSSVDSALQQYQAAEKASTTQSLSVSTQVTDINAPANAIKKISPN